MCCFCALFLRNFVVVPLEMDILSPLCTTIIDISSRFSYMIKKMLISNYQR
ncbi:hypothetical protein M758_UG006800 [Ceratodon purpureus]|nr:hypothetical protein M758_UG006800 [Ceratodon purpureus]